MAKTQNSIDFAATTNSQLAINLTSAGPNSLDVNGTLAVGTYAGTVSATPANSAIISGRAGIGTSAPLTNLHAAGSSTTAAGELGTFLISTPATSGPGNPRLIFGVNSSGSVMNYGYIQAVENGVANRPLVLQSNAGGGVLIGETTAPLSEKLGIAPDVSNRVCAYLTGTVRHTASAFGLYLDTALDTSGSGITTASALIFPNITNSGGGTVDTHYGLLISSGSMSITPTNSFGLYVQNPVAGTTRLAIASDGDVATITAGFGFKVKEGSNAKMGTATLVAGSSTVSTTAVTANSRIFLTVQQLGTIAVPTSIAVTARSAGTSFTITSLQATDTSVVAWIIFEPA